MPCACIQWFLTATALVACGACRPPVTIKQGVAAYFAAPAGDDEEPSDYALEAFRETRLDDIDDEDGRVLTERVASTDPSSGDDAWAELELKVGSYSVFIHEFSSESSNEYLSCDVPTEGDVLCAVKIGAGDVVILGESDETTSIDL